MRRASVETAGFLCSLANVRSPNESRGSGTASDVESMMKTSGRGLSQQPSFSSLTASTPAQLQDPALMDMYHQTRVLLSDVLKEKDQQNSEHQPFYNFIATEADRLPDARYDSFQAEVFNILLKYKRPDAPSQPTMQHQRLTQPVRSATVTSASQREGILPPVPLPRSNHGSTQGTT